MHQQPQSEGGGNNPQPSSHDQNNPNPSTTASSSTPIFPPTYPPTSSSSSNNPSADLYAAGLDTLAEAADSNSAALGSLVGGPGGEYEPFEALHEHLLGGGVGLGGMFGGTGVGGKNRTGEGMDGGAAGGKRGGDELLAGLRGMPYHFNHHPHSHHPHQQQQAQQHQQHQQHHQQHPSSSSGSQRIGSGGTGEYDLDQSMGNGHTHAHGHGHDDNLDDAGGGQELLDENGMPFLGGANARIQDDKQRKRIMQACEPCRIRKAKCNGLQPCGRCATRQLDCHFAHERKMRGPNKVKKTAEMKAQHRADRLARQAAKQRDGSGSLLVTPLSAGAQAGSEEEEMRATRLVVDAMTSGGLGVGPDGSVGMTLDAMGRYAAAGQGGGDQDSMAGGGLGGTDKQTRNKIGQHLVDEMRRGADYLSSFGAGAGGGSVGGARAGGTDSYDRTGQNGGYSFLDPEGGVDTGSTGGFGTYDQQGNTHNGQSGEYYSSFSRSNRLDKGDSRDDRSQHQQQQQQVHAALSMDSRARERQHQQHSGVRHHSTNDPSIDSRLDGTGNGTGNDNLDQDSTEAEDRARLAALIDGDPITGHDSHHQARYEGENSPGRVNSQGALAAYLLPDGGEEGDTGDFSPGGTEGGVGAGAW